jgi:MATE family multidrug resistance protein
MGEKGAAAPLLDGKIKINGEGEDAAAGSMRWWRRGVWDAEEAAGQVAFAAPMVATSMAFYAIPLVSVMYAGRIGDLELAGATLGNSWGTVTGIALMVFIYFISIICISSFSIYSTCLLPCSIVAAMATRCLFGRIPYS